MRQALFSILIGAPLRAVLDAGVALPAAPPVCDALAKKHIGESDAFYEFLLADYYSRVEGPGNSIKVSDLFDAFKSSEFYRSLASHEKKKYGSRAIVLSDLIRDHGILGCDFFKRDKYFAGVQLRSDCLVNYTEGGDDLV